MIFLGPSGMKDYDANRRQLQGLSDPIGRHTFLDQHLNAKYSTKCSMSDACRRGLIE
jgi:hypothetical protein